jgi:membrane protein implicated in regulation of membrane protease activity
VLLASLMLIPERFDTLLLVSTAIANVIGGLSRLGLGLLQLTGVLVVALLALLALVLLLGGMVRVARCLATPDLNRGISETRGQPVARTTKGR